ncbi:hypothetical protein [Natrinema versiforme]|uniref:Uncharacterized protein n=1 Tax=Natrinema versiforme JCM 10478 TaxID=1227496 RepID=L9Y486_9EURY|nr:hypothetical protein [Natrinema versiforme]ELY68502.1 hypothetical protein C489_07365 [Natrinema versiforme JCM 10478]
MPSAYCGECEWRYRADGADASELSRAMIDHFVETGHSPVERRDADDRFPADERPDSSSDVDERTRGPDERVAEPDERTSDATKRRGPSKKRER